MFVLKKMKRLVHQAVEAVGRVVRIVICRGDLPENPRWREQNYPYANCWGIDELFAEAAKAGPDSLLYREARRIWWEAYWRLLGRYRGARPFFEVYEVEDGRIEPVEDRERWVLFNIISSGFAHGIVPREALQYTYRIYRKLYGPLTA